MRINKKQILIGAMGMLLLEKVYMKYLSISNDDDDIMALRINRLVQTIELHKQDISVEGYQKIEKAFNRMVSRTKGLARKRIPFYRNRETMYELKEMSFGGVYANVKPKKFHISSNEGYFYDADDSEIPAHLLPPDTLYAKLQSRQERLSVNKSVCRKIDVFLTNKKYKANGLYYHMIISLLFENVDDCEELACILDVDIDKIYSLKHRALKYFFKLIAVSQDLYDDPVTSLIDMLDDDVRRLSVIELAERLLLVKSKYSCQYYEIIVSLLEDGYFDNILRGHFNLTEKQFNNRKKKACKNMLEILLNEGPSQIIAKSTYKSIADEIKKCNAAKAIYYMMSLDLAKPKFSIEEFSADEVRKIAENYS